MSSILLSRKIGVVIATVLIIALVTLLGVKPAFACGSGGDCLSPHAYAAQENNSTTQYGLYFAAYYGQEDFSSDWANNATDEWSFTNKEEWEAFPATSQGGQWIEAGATNGYKDGGYWAGHFVAYQECQPSCTYQEYLYGSEYPTGVHNYEIQYIGSNYWRTYVDGNTVEDFYFPYTSSSNQFVGIEGDDPASSFTYDTKAEGIEYKDQNGVWQHWQTAVNDDQGPLTNWSSAFSYDPSTGTNEIDFYN